MAIANVLMDTSADEGSKLDPEMRAEIEFLAPGLSAGEVGETELAEHSVSTDKIQPGAVTSVEIAEGGVKRVNIEPDAVGTTELDDDAVTAAKAGLGVSTAYDINGNPIEDKRVYCTAAQYASLAVKDPNTEYLVTA